VIAAVDLAGRSWMLRGYSERRANDTRKKPPSHGPRDGERAPSRSPKRAGKPKPGRKQKTKRAKRK
jgi:hypothetical protein